MGYPFALRVYYFGKLGDELQFVLSICKQRRLGITLKRFAVGSEAVNVKRWCSAATLKLHLNGVWLVVVHGNYFADAEKHDGITYFVFIHTF